MYVNPCSQFLNVVPKSDVYKWTPPLILTLGVMAEWASFAPKKLQMGRWHNLLVILICLDWTYHFALLVRERKGYHATWSIYQLSRVQYEFRVKPTSCCDGRHIGHIGHIGIHNGRNVTVLTLGVMAEWASFAPKKLFIPILKRIF